MTALQLYSTIFVSCGFLRLNKCDGEFYCFFKALLLTVASTCTHEQTHPHTWVLRKYKQTNNYAPGWVVHLFLSVLLVMRVVCPLVLSWPNPKEVRKCGSSRSIILPTPTLPRLCKCFSLIMRNECWQRLPRLTAVELIANVSDGELNFLQVPSLLLSVTRLQSSFSNEVSGTLIAIYTLCPH